MNLVIDVTYCTDLVAYFAINGSESAISKDRDRRLINELEAYMIG